jgi:hypothetical protein
MSDTDWEVTTWEGNRRAQREAFMRLSFREKILELERLSDVAEALQKGRRTPPGIGRSEKP